MSDKIEDDNEILDVENDSDERLDEKSDSVLPNYEPCLICGGKTKGLHFQVTSCRACAAFYRRTIKSGRIYRCQKGTKNCDLNIKGKGKPLCRYCRMQKCKEVGMRLVEEDLQDEARSHTASTTSPITSPQVSHSSTESTTSPTISSYPLGSPEKLAQPIPINVAPQILPQFQQPTSSYVQYGQNECLSQAALLTPAPRIEGKRLIYDCNPLIHAIKNTLNQPAKSLYLTHGIHLSFMQQLQYAFSQFQTLVLPPPNTIIETVHEYEMDMMKFNELYMSSLAEMLMKCEHFAQLPLSDKYTMFKRFWPLFQGIERTFATTLLLGTSPNDNRLLMSDRFAIDFNQKHITSKGFPQESMDKLKPYMENLHDISSRFLLQPLKAMRITAFEVVYLAGYILWTVHGIRGLSEATLSIAEDIYEQCASELHNYYVYEMRLPNYAPRLAKLTKIVSAAEYSVHAKKDFSTMAKVFDIFDCDFCQSELMDL